MPTSLQVAYRYSHTIGLYAQIGRGFNNPVDIALGRNGVLYVLNRAGADTEVRMPYKRVTICTVHEDYHGDFSSGGTADGQIMWPVAIALDQEENIYISDEALQRISIFNQQGQFLGKWGVPGGGTGEFDRPAGIAFDQDGHLLVVDSRNNRVQRYTRDGQFLGAWGHGGHGPGELYMPWGMALDQSGNVYIADWRNDRIQKFDAQGQYLASWGTPGQSNGEFRRPSGVAVDREGYIYVADWGNERVQVLRPDGNWQATLRGEAGLSRWAKSYFVANQDELEERQRANLEPPLELLPQDERREESASIEKLFWGPVSVKVDEQGRLYVVESCRHRLQVYCKHGS
ncbi:MAG TPA: NHL repeat-containing protein [Candidatus Tectomicrobia bacterium]|jgi:DNA-binding beta-propeller fold protein YncE